MKIKNKKLFALYIFAFIILILLILVRGAQKIILVILFWIIGNYIYAENIGWRKISELYKFKRSEYLILEKRIFGFVYFGDQEIGNILTILISDKGILLKPIILFRFGRPPIFIPWDEIFEMVIQDISVPKTSVNLITKGIDRAFGPLYANLKLKKLPDFVLIVPWKQAYVNNVPKSIELKYEEGIDLNKG